MKRNRLLFLISVIFSPLLVPAQNNDYTSKVNEILQSTDGFGLEAECNINLKSMSVTVGKTNVSIKNVVVFPNLQFLRICM